MDCFAEMGLARRLDLSAEELREAYDQRCRQEHPDAGGDRDRFQRMREVHEILSDPGQRLRHWLDLVGEGFDGGPELPPRAEALFAELGPVLQGVDRLLERKQEAQSALGRSLVEREALSQVEGLDRWLQRLDQEIEACTLRFEEFEEAATRGEFVEAQECAKALLFLGRWREQVRERWTRLAL